MQKRNTLGRRLSRRAFMQSSVAAGAVVASATGAPRVLAQSTAPIRIGNVNSYTGGIAYAGENNLNGMNLYFDSINWTVAGRKIELVKEDDQFNPQVGLQKAKKLVESDKVDLIIGIQASNVALAVLNYMKQQKAFYIVSGAGTDAITWDRYPYLFRTSISTYQLSTPMAHYIYDNLGKEVVTTASDYAGGRDVMAQFKGPYLDKGGKVLKEIWTPLGTTDFSAYLTDIKSINPPVTYDFMPGADGVRFIQQYSEFGLKEKMPSPALPPSTRRRRPRWARPRLASFPRSPIPTLSTIRRARNSPRLLNPNTNTRRTYLRIMAMSAPKRSARHSS